MGRGAFQVFAESHKFGNRIGGEGSLEMFAKTLSIKIFEVTFRNNRNHTRPPVAAGQLYTVHR